MKTKKFISIAVLLFASLLTATAMTQKDERVAVDITIKIQAKGATTLNLKKSPLCQSYSLGLFTADIATHIGDGSLAQYFSNQKSKKYNADAKGASLLDFGFAVLPEKDYTLLALAYDKDGNPGVVTRTNFTTPKRVPVGSPKMTWQVLALGPDSVTVKFTPNADIAGYALCQFETGTMEKTVEAHGRLMGFSNAHDMIKRFSGKSYTTERTNTWRDMIPNTEYDLCIAPWDKNGVFLDIETVKVTTLKLGGPGEASVDIRIGEFGGGEDTGYYQVVFYTPNDQAALHQQGRARRDRHHQDAANGRAQQSLLESIQGRQGRMEYGTQHQLHRLLHREEREWRMGKAEASEIHHSQETVIPYLLNSFNI